MIPIICLLLLIGGLGVVALTNFGEHNKGIVAVAVAMAAILLTGLFLEWQEVAHKITHSWVHIMEIACLVTFFTMLGYIFKTSKMPNLAPKWLPDGEAAPFVLLAIVFFLSAGLDNIACALLGVTTAKVVFKKLHLAYVVAIVTAANAGGSWSPFGDTTTMMIVGKGYPVSSVLGSIWGALTVLVLVGWFATKKQNRLCKITADPETNFTMKWDRVWAVGGILLASLSSLILLGNPLWGLIPASLLVWIVLTKKGEWKKGDHENALGELLGGLKSSLFLCSLIMAAQFVELSFLPNADALGGILYGLLSAGVDNIPVTEVGLLKGGIHAALLAFAAGTFGSVNNFASSAGVAVMGQYEPAQSAKRWFTEGGGWFVLIASCIGYAVNALILSI